MLSKWVFMYSCVAPKGEREEKCTWKSRVSQQSKPKSSGQHERVRLKLLPFLSVANNSLFQSSPDNILIG